MNISRCKNFVYILLALSTIIFITIRTVSSQEGCGECPNPLVGVQELKIGGNIEAVLDIINGFADFQFPGRLPVRFAGFEALLGKGAFSPLYLLWDDVYTRALELSDFRKRNPCAKIFFAYRETFRAKYIVRSTATIELGNGSVEVEHYSDSGVERRFVPRVGTIEIRNELIALKNGDIYDTGENIIDWVHPPPPPSDWYKGINREGFGGVFDTDTLHRQPIVFNKGDIGITIRKKETPSSCSIDVDDASEFPPYYKIRVTNIKNQFNETMPNNVLIALKAQKGKIVNGDELNGWRIFNTQKGRVVEPVLYEPPSCAEAETDTLEIAGVCDFHDGPPSVGKTRIKKEIPNSQCYDAVAIVTGKQVVIEEGEFNYSGSGESKTLKKKYRKEIEATIHLMLTQTDTLPMIMQNEYSEYYEVKSAHLTNFKAELRDWEYDYQKKTNSWSEVTETWVGHSSGEKVWEPPGYLPEVFSEGIIVVFDVETKKAKVVNIFFKNRIEYKFSKTLTQEGRGSGGSWKHSEKEEDIEHYYIGLVHEQIASPDCLVTSGDGINFMAGSGKATIDCSNEGDYATCTTEKTFSWEFRRMKKKRR